MAGQVLAVASGKGGVGKTTTVVNLGVVLRRDDHTVALVDADLGMANLDTMLGISGESTLHDVLAGEATVEEALVEEAPGFGVLTGSGELAAYPDAAPEGLGDVLETLAESYDYVLVDTGAGMSHEDVLPLGLADRVILVTSPDPAAIGDTRKTAELSDLAKGAIAGVVVTKADDSTDSEAVAREVGAPLLGVIPFDPTVRRSTAAATPLEAVDPDGAAATAYRELAGVVVEQLDSPSESTEAADTSEAPPQADSAASEADPVEADTGEPGGDRAEDPDDPIPDLDEEEPEVSGDGEGRPDDGTAETEGPKADPDDEAELEEYLEEFEDEESTTSGGFFARLRRLL